MDILIRQATESDAKTIADIGRVAVEESHRNSCSDADMEYFLSTYYNEEAIKNELSVPEHICYVIFYRGQPAGFSKIILDTGHERMPHRNVTKLDRIYLDSEFYDLKLGYHLLQHGIDLSKQNDQQGMWLFTWVGNQRAVNFYKKNGFAVMGNHRFKVSETHYNEHHHMFLEYGV